MVTCQCETNSRIQWISNTTITDALKAMAAKHILVVADSCYSGTLVRGIDVVRPPSGGERDTYLARIAQKRSRTVLTSGGLEPVSDSGGGKEHSVFAKAFLTALQENPRCAGRSTALQPGQTASDPQRLANT